MAFQYTALGRLLARDPAAAHERLQQLFTKHACKVSAVAKDLGTSAVQVRRWIKRLTELGYADPGGGTRAVRGPAAKKRSKLTA